MYVIGLAATPLDVVAQDAPYEENNIYYGCGEPKPHNGYELTFGGETISLPRYIIIVRNGNTLYSDEKTKVWESSYNGARYAIVGDWLLILTSETDCIDLDYKRLFIIRPGEPIIHQPVWTGNWKDGFFLEHGHLTYWSEWFCHPENKERTDNISYVYTFNDDAESFVQVKVENNMYCLVDNEPTFIEFNELPYAE